MFFFFAFLVKKTSGILFFGPSFRKPARKASSGDDVHDAFRAGLRKLGPKNNIPEVFLTRKAKNKILYKIKYEIKFKLILYKMKIR